MLKFAELLLRRIDLRALPKLSVQAFMNATEDLCWRWITMQLNFLFFTFDFYSRVEEITVISPIREQVLNRRSIFNAIVRNLTKR